MTNSSGPRLVLTLHHVLQVIDHARAEQPNEACGLLGGRGGRVEKVYRLVNAEQSSVRYLAEPQGQLDAMLDIEDRSREIVGIYHSHVDAPAYPSPIDVEMAYYPGAITLIVSLADQESPVLGAFRIRDRRIEEADIIIEDTEMPHSLGQES
ncbi:MAG: M67 family metallopeptidase [Anaerolineae bacterium]